MQVIVGKLLEPVLPVKALCLLVQGIHDNSVGKQLNTNVRLIATHPAKAGARQIFAHTHARERWVPDVAAY
jgi:hypothetical protein